MNAVAKINQLKEYVGVHAILACLLTAFLFFIDEGYYNFNWMLNWGNWIIFFIYSLGIFSGQIIAQHVVFRKQTGAAKIVLSFLLGGTLGFGAMVYLFTLWMR